VLDELSVPGVIVVSFEHVFERSVRIDFPPGAAGLDPWWRRAGLYDGGEAW
jgi:hypothetical protein